MPQWFCWYSRSGLRGHSRTQCGSWKVTFAGSKPSTTSSPFTSGAQVGPRSSDSCTPPLDMRHVEVRRVARVDDDRVQLGAVGRAVLLAAHPRAVLRVVVEPGHRLPGDAAVLGAEQALRRGARVPDAGLARVAGRQPEGVVDGAALHRPLAPSGTPAAALPPSRCGRGRWSERRSGRGGRSSPPPAACGRRAGRAPGG